jgi:hypothetical protein
MVVFSSYYMSFLESTGKMVIMRAQNCVHCFSHRISHFQKWSIAQSGTLSSHMTHNTFHDVPKFWKIFIYLLNAYCNNKIIFS